MAEIFGIVIPFAYLCAALNKCSRAKLQNYFLPKDVYQTSFFFI